MAGAFEWLHAHPLWMVAFYGSLVGAVLMFALLLWKFPADRQRVRDFVQQMPGSVWRNLKWPFTNRARIAASILLVVGGVVARVGYLQQHRHRDWLTGWENLIADFYANFSAEFISIAITVLIIEHANRLEALRERKEELILQMSSDERVIAVEAARVLRIQGWLQDGSLKGANLREANLRGAKLEKANLSDVNLKYANLNRANLKYANLSRADLTFAYLGWANLTGVDMRSANLRGANLSDVRQDFPLVDGVNLSGACLQDADLSGTDLRGADLRDANLKGAKNVPFAKFNNKTVLPDGTNWVSGTDMTRYTDPNHKDFRPHPRWGNKDG